MLTRRRFINTGLVGAGAVTFGPAFWRNALAQAPVVKVAEGPYGALQAADANGIMLPAGFTSRVVARGGQPVGTTGYVFPNAPDGSAVFPTSDGGWILAVNTEVPAIGGASGIRFASDGAVSNAYRILENTNVNCAGGPTPWGKWLSCEETDTGLVWDCDPTGATPAVARPALGAFKHEAACVDPERGHVFLSEDVDGGGFYRFRPTAYPDLSGGTLEIATDGGSGKITWKPVPDPSGGIGATRTQVAGTLPFRRGEGIWYDGDTVYLATTTDETIHAYDCGKETVEVLYKADAVADTPLRGVDNLHVSRSGDLFVAEDSYTNDPDAMDVCIITPKRELSRFLKLTGAEHFMPGSQSETTGLCFTPDGQRMYVSSQRGGGGGIVYEISGPFRLTQPVDPFPSPVASPSPTPTPSPATPIGFEVAKRLRLTTFLRRGLPVALTLDQSATVNLRLTARLGGKTVVLDKLEREVDQGPELLTLRPGPKLRKRLRKRKAGLRVALEARITVPGDDEQVITRSIRLKRKPKK